MKEALKEIEKLLRKFIKQYSLDSSNLEIEGVVYAFAEDKSLSIECKDEFDDLSVGELKEIKKELTYRIRRTMNYHKIKETFVIETEYSHNDQPIGFNLYFKKERLVITTDYKTDWKLPIHSVHN